MTLSINLKSPERLLFLGESVAAGTFRCQASDPLFADSGPSNSHAVVFPRAVVRITHTGGPSFVGDPTIVPLYNRGQEYARKAISDCDHSDWLALSDAMLIEILDRHHLRYDSPGRPFAVAWTRAQPSVYLEQRALFARLESSGPVDQLDAEESAVLLVDQIIGQLASEVTEERISRIDRKAEAAKEAIARSLDTNISLSALAATLAESPYRLCRLFKAATGLTLTEYRHDLRLRLALERLGRPGADILQIAVDLGFASHSHFTALFRRRFGLTPSRFREQLRSTLDLA